MVPEYRDLNEEDLISHSPNSSECISQGCGRPAVLNQSICLRPGHLLQSIMLAGTRAREPLLSHHSANPRSTPSISSQLHFMAGLLYNRSHTAEGSEMSLFLTKKMPQRNQNPTYCQRECRGRCPRNQSGNSFVKCSIII